MNLSSPSIPIVEADCPLCGADRPEILLDGLEDVEDRVPGQYAIGRCAQCGLVYLSRRPTAESLPRCYPQNYHVHEQKQRGGAIPQFLFGLRLKARYRRLREVIGESCGNLLEIGCGDGGFLKLLDREMPSDCRLTGIDLLVSPTEKGAIKESIIEPTSGRVGRARPPAALRAALRAGRAHRGRLGEPSLPRTACSFYSDLACTARLEFIRGEFETTVFPVQYDVVILFAVLEHLADPVGSLKKIARLLKPGGLLLAQVPNWNSCWRKVFPRHWQGLQIPRHQTQFEPRTLRQTLDAAGYDIRGEKFIYDPGDLSVTLCNWIADRLKLKTPPRQVWFYFPVVVLSAPIVWLVNVLTRNSGVIEVVARKRGEKGD
jgi:SAM-dependent methyltransferase